MSQPTTIDTRALLVAACEAVMTGHGTFAEVREGAPQELTLPAAVVLPTKGSLKRATDRRQQYRAAVRVPLDLVFPYDESTWDDCWEALRLVLKHLSAPGTTWSVTGFDEQVGRSGDEHARMLVVVLAHHTAIDLTASAA